MILTAAALLALVILPEPFARPLAYLLAVLGVSNGVMGCMIFRMYCREHLAMQRYTTDAIRFYHETEKARARARQ